MKAELLPCGERAVLVQVADLDEVLALQAAVTARVELTRAGSLAPSVWGRVLDVVPAARTLLIALDGVTTRTLRGDAPSPASPSSDGGLAELRRAIAVLAEETDMTPALGREDGVDERDTAGTDAGEARVVTIPVVYDGPDLEEVASLTGLSATDVVAAHTGTTWRVAFGGFAPGFAYLAGGDPRLDVPRRSEPRPKVPVGAVGLAGAFSGIYPRASPGGWQLIGRTEETLWDEQRDPPALLRPGWSVRFEAIDPVTSPSGETPGGSDDSEPESADSEPAPTGDESDGSDSAQPSSGDSDHGAQEAS